MSNKKPKPVIVRAEDMPSDLVRHDIDLSYLFNGEKTLRSIKVVRDGTELWLARHHSKGDYFTNNTRDPKILNTETDRPRGNISWRQGGGNPTGRPKGATNRISVKQACERMNANPAEFLAALVSGRTSALKQHHIKDPKSLTLAQRIKAAEILLNKTVPNLRSVDLGTDGEPSVPQETLEQEASQKIQVYLPQKGAYVEVEASEEEIKQMHTLGADNYLTKHESDVLPYDKEDEDDTFTWKDQEEG